MTQGQEFIVTWISSIILVEDNHVNKYKEILAFVYHSSIVNNSPKNGALSCINANINSIHPEICKPYILKVFNLKQLHVLLSMKKTKR